MARTKASEEVAKKKKSSSEAALLEYIPGNLLVVSDDGEYSCRRCYEGPSYKKGHAYNCQHSRFYNMSVEEIEALQMKEGITTSTPTNKKRSSSSSTANNGNNKKKKSKIAAERNLTMEIDGEEVCRRCHLGSSFKKGHATTCQHSKYYLG